MLHCVIQDASRTRQGVAPEQNTQGRPSLGSQRLAMSGSTAKNPASESQGLANVARPSDDLRMRTSPHASAPWLPIERIARVLYPAAVGVIVSATLWVSSLFSEPPRLSIAAVLGLIAWVALLSEAIRHYSQWLERRWPWHAHPARRALLQVGGSTLAIIIFSLLVYIPLKLHEIRNGANDSIGWPHLTVTALIATVFSLALNALHVTLDFHSSLQRAQREARDMQAAMLRAELDTLKAQINPHFLFNSLNTVHGLIVQDPALARGLLLELSDVLRYALGHSNHDLVPLARELEFLHAYRALLQARHGEGLRVDIQSMDRADDLMIPPMSLQVLVENAVRHNRTREDDPLVVDVRLGDHGLRVSNAIKPRHSPNPGAGTGLANIEQRYRLLGADGIRVIRESSSFIVELGLLARPKATSP